MKAELKHLKYYLDHGLELYNPVKKDDPVKVIGFEKDSLLIIEDDNKYYSAFGAYKPLLRPLSYLIKEIEFEGEKFRPMFKLLQLVSGQKEILSETIEYSFDPEGKAYFIRVNYKGFFVILAYDLNDKSFRMIRNGKIFSINNQLEAFELLFKWHFNVYEVESIDK